MALTPVTLISGRTAAVTTAVGFQAQQKFIPATLMATNLAGSESVAVLYSVDGGLTFEPLSQDGADLTLTATANTFAIVSPLHLGVTKTSTSGLGGVFVLSNQTPGTP